MENKENVYGITQETEQIAAVNTGERVDRTEIAPKEGSAVPDKFKDVDALARAYNSLQAEFTRRSQRLKELEKKVENWKDGKPDGTDSGAGKLRKNAEARRVAAKEFDEFLSEVEVGRAERTDGKPTEENETLVETVGETENGLTKVGADGGSAGTGNSTPTASATGETEKPHVATSGIFELSSDALYERVCRDEGVRLKIIGEYLASIGKSGAPLTTGVRGTFVSAPVKAKSIGDAGGMALQYFKKAVQTQ